MSLWPSMSLFPIDETFPGCFGIPLLSCHTLMSFLQLPPRFSDLLTLPLGSGVWDDGGRSFDSLIARLVRAALLTPPPSHSVFVLARVCVCVLSISQPSAPEFYRGRNVAVQRVVQVCVCVVCV